MCIILQDIRAVLCFGAIQQRSVQCIQRRGDLHVAEVSGVESVLEGQREAAGEQSAGDVCDWVDDAQGVDCGNDKRFAIIVC